MAAFPPHTAFTIKANGKMNRLITDVSACLGFDPANPPNPLPTKANVKGLWDTGATGSVISTDLVKALNLTPVGTANVNHGGGKTTSPTYLVNVELHHKVEFIGVLVTEFPRPDDGSFDVILGMDVICFGDFALTNHNDKTCFSFRTPSCESVDYVIVANEMQYAGLGRNDPCRCGSGKKFKKCHGASV
jgi:hypothetical protein